MKLFKGQLEWKDSYRIEIEKDCFRVLTNFGQTYYQEDNGYWFKVIFDEDGKVVYKEDSDGVIEDNRTKIYYKISKTTLVDLLREKRDFESFIDEQNIKEIE